MSVGCTTWAMRGKVKRLLLTTIHRPLGITSETCGPHIVAEMYHAQLTGVQGPFSIRSICIGWGLEFLARNLETPTTVLHFPTLSLFIRELKKGYDFVGIAFVISTFPKAVELCRIVRREAPGTKIILGSYGTMLPECDQYADYVCREEGVGFLKRLLGEGPAGSFQPVVIKRSFKVMSVSTPPAVLIPTGLGCTRGCDFCATSHFFHRRYIPLLKTGRELHDAMCSVDFPGTTFRDVGIMDEDFLADRRRIAEMIPLNAAEVEKPVLFSCLSSLRSLAQYSTDELISMGLSGVLIGIESEQATYAKLAGVDARATFATLRSIGVSIVASMIVGFEWHDELTIERDFQYLMSLRPTFSQFMLYTPCPQTPLHRRLKAEGRLYDIPYQFRDGYHLTFRHPHFSDKRLEQLMSSLMRRDYEELGPSICRVLEAQLLGWQNLHESPSPLYRARAREHKNMCLKIYPLLRHAIGLAPGPKARRYLTDLRSRVEDEFRIPSSARVKETVVPILSLYTRMKDRLFPNPQPKPIINRYRQGASPEN
jgi:hypothetical protein